MGVIVKLLLAFGAGWALLVGAQHLWTTAMVEQVAAAARQPAPLPQAPPVASIEINPEELRKALAPPQIDTREGERLGVESAARQIDMMRRNALSHVPVYGPNGLPRH